MGKYGKCTTYSSREEWLMARSNTIGGSDAASVVGKNPWRSNVELWEILTGRVKAPDISNNDYVKYGTQAEAPLREIFKLDFPQYEMYYEENNMFTNSYFPWGHYSADGMLKDPDGRHGIWECKTTNITSSASRDKWDGKIPTNYLYQLLHGMLITGAEFAVLKAQLRSQYTDGNVLHVTKHYFFERSDYYDEIAELREKERKFWECVVNDEKPALILPL